MASIKEIISIIESTPNEQAIMLEGIHGIGKSETIKYHFEKKGYNVVILFLGQMSDAGDVLGLPDRKEIEVNGEKLKVTDFCPPSWWPHDKDQNCIIFLDELNRAKPELHQVIMDMVLNRKLYNRALPKNARIVAAINPINDGYYQVEEMDPALIDRFNKYEFKPTHDEWMDWAIASGVHRTVLSFISKHADHLDPPVGHEYKVGSVTPSRRSWKKVSDIIQANEDLLSTSKINLLKTMMLGLVGEHSTAAFGKHLKEMGTGLNVGKILTAWDESVETSIKTECNTQDIISMNKQIIHWFNNNNKIIESDANETAGRVANNLENYLNTIALECMADFFSRLAVEANDKEKKWPKKLSKINPAIASKFMAKLLGEDDAAPNIEF